MHNLILELKNLDKVYPSGIHAVKKINFQLERGRICALLGPNGAGKSTTLGMICTLVKPGSGEILFDGRNVAPGDSEYHSSIGVVSQHANLEMDLTAYQNLKVHALLYNVDKKKREERISRLLALAGLEGFSGKQVRFFSGGMKRKLQIVRALLHSPRLLILDEPTVGLDPASRETIWDMIIKLNREGMSILFSTHYMDEAQQYSERVSIIHKGQIIRDGKVRDLINEKGAWCRVEFSDAGRRTSFFDTRESAMAGNPAMADNSVKADNPPMIAHGSSKPAEPAAAGTQLIIRETTLEDLFISLTGKEL
jgi:ABC-2 type transport system ATP-binding protein